MLLLKAQLMQQSVLWERLIFLYNCLIFPMEELIFSPKRGLQLLSFVNIGVNNLRKIPVLQLKQSNLPLALYLLNEQFVREKHLLGHTCHGLDD